LVEVAVLEAEGCQFDSD